MGLRRAAVALLALTGCGFDAPAGVRERPRAAVRGVLDPGAAAQVILVELTRVTGRSPMPRRFDPLDPIVSTDGVPVSGATVVVLAEGGDSVVALEDLATRGDGRGAGVYRFYNPAAARAAFPAGRTLAIGPGRRYRLRVTTPLGTVTGETLVPDALPAPLAPPEPFDRDGGALRFTWDAVPGAARYLLRVETPAEPYVRFIDSLRYVLPGTAANPVVASYPFLEVFAPGFRQTATLAAVDRNYADYFRYEDETFGTGNGAITHLEGGVGVFGAYVLLQARTLDVVAAEDLPIEGRYELAQGPAGTPAILQLYAEAVDGDPARTPLFGHYLFPGDTVRRGLVGLLEVAGRDSIVALEFLRGQRAGEPALSLKGALRDGALVGAVSPDAESVAYRKR